MSSKSSSKTKRGNTDIVFGFAGGKRQKREAEAAALATLQNVNIQKIIESSGPIVNCVMLRADGSIEAVDVDMTPSQRRCQELLGGELTFLGQWEDLQVVLLASKDQSGNLPLNKHKLQPPFHDVVAYGDILLTRSDDDGEAAHFPLSEYMSFKDQVIETWKPSSDAEKDSEDEDDNEDMPELSEEEALAAFLPQLVEAFRAEYKREPNEDELNELKAQILDDEEDPEYMLARVLPALVATFKKQNGREPTAEEIAAMKEQILAEDSEYDDSEGDEDSEDDEDRENDEDGEELETVIEQILPKLIASFADQNGREPTDAELEVLKDRLRVNLMAQVEADGSGNEDDEKDDEDDEEDEEAYAQISKQKGF